MGASFLLGMFIATRLTIKRCRELHKQEMKDSLKWSKEWASKYYQTKNKLDTMRKHIIEKAEHIGERTLPMTDTRSSNLIPVLIIDTSYDRIYKDEETEMFKKQYVSREPYVLRMDKPFETYLAQLMIKLANEVKTEGQVAVIRMERWEEEKYLSEPITQIKNPTYVSSGET